MLEVRQSRFLWSILLIIIVSVFCPSAFGKIMREWWLDVPGANIGDLTSNPRYPNSPDGYELLDIFEGPVNWGNNYGSRFQGWLLPPKSGEYTFWIASDDCSELRLSIHENPANSQVIASVNGWTRSQEWEKYDTQKSEPIILQAGYKYYIEVLMKESGGGDNIAVAWQPPGNTRQIISGTFVDTVGPLQALAPSPTDGATRCF